MTPVEFHFVAPDGVPISNTQFEIQASRSGFDPEDSGVLMPRELLATTDEFGKVVVEMLPSSVMYYVTAFDTESKAGLSYKFYVPEVEAGETVRLQDLVVELPMSTVPWDEAAVVVIVDAKAAAMAYRNAAQAANTAAGISETNAAGSAASALTSQTDAAASALNAHQDAMVYDEVQEAFVEQAAATAEAQAQLLGGLSESAKKVELAATNGATKIGTPDGTVQEVLDKKKTIISTDAYGGDIELAIAAGAAIGAANVEVELGDESFLNGVNTGFVTGTKIITQPNVWLRGKGQPGHNGNFVTVPPIMPTKLIGGSRIMGGLFFAADGFKITDCGLDCGADYVNANNGGTPIEGLVGIDRGNTGMDGYTSVGPNSDTPKHNLYIDKVIVLNKGTGAPGDTSNVHSMLLENYVSGGGGELSVIFGGAGIVIKSSNLKIKQTTSIGNYKYSLLFKSEDYADASDCYVDVANVSNYKTQAPNISGTGDYDSSGVWFQAANADLNGCRVGTLIANAVTDPVVFDALPTHKVKSCSVGKSVARNSGGYAMQTRGECIDCTVENMDHDTSLRGVLIQAGAVRCGVINSVVKNVLQYSYRNYGVDSFFINARSVNPGFAHIALDAGSARFLGDFATDNGSIKPLMVQNGGTYTGLFQQTGLQTGGLTVTPNDLIVKGSGDSVEGWTTPGGGAIVTIDPGGVVGNCFKLTQPPSGTAYFTRQFVTQVGKKYRVSLYQKNGTGSGGTPGAARFFLGKTTYLSAEYTGGTHVALNNATWTKYSFLFTADATACFLTFQSATGIGSNTFLDEIICSETPGIHLGTDTLVTGGLIVKDMPVYANNAAAVAAGLEYGQFYRTGSDPDPVCFVH